MSVRSTNHCPSQAVEEENDAQTDITHLIIRVANVGSFNRFMCQPIASGTEGNTGTRPQS